MLNTKSILILFCILQGSGIVQAQEEIASDRPAFTWSSSALKNKQIQVQSGFNFFMLPSNLKQNNTWNFENLIRFGLPAKFELDAGYTYTSLIPSLLNSNTLTTCLRYQVSNNEGFVPQSTLIYKFDYILTNQKLPSKIAHSLHYSASWQLSDKLGFASATFFNVDKKVWMGTTLNLSYNLQAGWGLVGEALVQPNETVYYNLALTYKPKPNLMFDIFCGPQMVGDNVTAYALQGGFSRLIESKKVQ